MEEKAYEDGEAKNLVYPPPFLGRLHWLLCCVVAFIK
jgi:hypothetical protein